MFSNKIGAKVLLSFLVAIIPLIGVIASLNVHIKLDAMAFARNLIFRTVFEAAAEQDELVAELREMLRRLAGLAKTKTLAIAPLEVALRRVKQEKPFLANIFLCDRRGVIVASAEPGYVGTDVSQRAYVRDALDQGRLAFGQYLISRVTGKPVMDFSLPVQDEAGTTVGVLVASLPLTSPLPNAFRLAVPPGGFLEMVDSRGVRLWRYPATAEQPGGQRLSEALIRTLFHGQGFGTASWGAPAAEVLFAYRQLHAQGSGPQPYGALIAGLPVTKAMAPAREQLLRSALLSACSVIAAVIVAVILGRKVIVDRLRILADQVAAVQHDRVCLLPSDFGTDEIGLLGRRFTDMSRELHDKNQALAETMTHLCREKEELQAVVHQLGEARKKLERQAKFDALTGLRNRRSFNERLRWEFSRWRRYDTPLSLVLLDIDDFKHVNDSFGHWAGDETLQAVSRRVRRRLREADEAYRVGGEEFALLLPQTRADDALVVAERVRQIVSASAIPLSDGGQVRVTISLGLAECRPGLPAQKDLYTAADRALYQAKTQGKNRVEVWKSPPAA